MAQSFLRTGLALPAGNGERLLLGVQCFALLAMTASVATRVWQDQVWFGVALIVFAVAVWAPEFTRRRDRLAWFFYVTGTFGYTLLRALADETAIGVRTQYVIEMDAALPGSSVVPLLQKWRDAWEFHRLVDYFAIGTHWSYFILPHAAAVVIFVARRRAFPRYVAVMVLSVWLGLLLFFLVPTVPPWLAGEQGDLPGVVRVMDERVRRALEGDASATYDELYKGLGEPNSVAAMPSIHMAITFAMFLWSLRYARRFAPWLLAYAIIMGFSLAYLGEHYLADELAGIAVATVSWVIVLRLPFLRPGPRGVPAPAGAGSPVRDIA